MAYDTKWSQAYLNCDGKGVVNDLFTIREVAAILNVHPTTVKRWIISGAIECIMLPVYGKKRHHRIKRQTVDAILNGFIEG